MVENLEACHKFYDQKANNKTVTHQYSKYGDIAQISEDTFVDCNRNLIGMQQFHSVHPKSAR